MTESVLRHEIAQEQGYVTMLYEVLDRARDRATAELRRVHGRSDDRHRPGGDRTRVLRPDLRGSFGPIDDRRARIVFRPDRRRSTGRRSTSAVSGSSTMITIRCSSTGARRWRNPSTGRRRRTRSGCSGGAISGSTGRTVVAVDDDILDLAALADHDRRDLIGEAALFASLSADRTGRMSEIVATIQAEQDAIIRSGPARGAGGPGWSRHRQDRRRVAPRRVPALHPPRPARPARGAGGRPERDLPALHRAGAALARRDRGGAVHHRRVAPRGGRRPRPNPRRRAGSRAASRWSRSSPAPSGPCGAAGPGTTSRPSACSPCSGRPRSDSPPPRRSSPRPSAPRCTARPGEPWTRADVALLDEAADLLGDTEAVEQQRRRAAAERAAEDAEHLAYTREVVHSGLAAGSLTIDPLDVAAVHRADGGADPAPRGDGHHRRTRRGRPHLAVRSRHRRRGAGAVADGVADADAPLPAPVDDAGR